MKLRSKLLAHGPAGATAAIAGVAMFVAVALFAHADVGPAVSVSILNNSNVAVTTLPIGSTAYANAVVASSTGPVALGTVDFSLYPNTSCSGTPSVQAGVALASSTTASSTASSATTTVPASGLSYKVHYSGQQGVYPSNDSVCVALAASATPSISTALSTTTIAAGGVAHDSATLTNMTSAATGTVAYTVFSNNVCTQGAQSAGIKTVSNGSIANSDAVQFPAAGTFYWQAAYSGDQFNAPVVSACQSEVLTVNATTTTQGGGTQGGGTGTTTIDRHHEGDNDGDEADDDAGQAPLFKQLGLHDEGLHLGWFKHGNPAASTTPAVHVKEKNKHDGAKGHDSENNDD